MRTFGRCWRYLWSSWESLGISRNLQEPSINASGLRQLRDDWEELPSLRIHWDLPGFHPEFALFVPNPIGSKPKSHQMQTQIPADPTQNPVGSNSKSQWMQSQIPTDRSPNSSRSNPKSQWIQHQIPLAPTLSLGVAHSHLCQELSLSAPDLPNLGGYRQRCELGWDPAGVGLGLPLPFHSGSRSGRGGDE